MSERAASSVAAGWPRPHLPCSADASQSRLLDGGQQRPNTRPVPWLAMVWEDGAWDPWGFDIDRSKAAIEHNLCQVCGVGCGDTVWVIASERPERAYRKRAVEMYGAAVCSLRCARLTAAVCPHYREMWPVGCYEVPAGERCDFNGCGENTDTEHDLTGLTPSCVIGGDS